MTPESRAKRCGLGNLEWSDPYVACDRSEPLIEYARRRQIGPRVSFVVAGVGQLPTRSGGFDSVTKRRPSSSLAPLGSTAPTESQKHLRNSKGARSAPYVQPVGIGAHRQPRHEARRDETTPPAHEVLVDLAGCPLVAQLRHDASLLHAAQRRALEPRADGRRLARSRLEARVRRQCTRRVTSDMDLLAQDFAVGRVPGQYPSATIVPLLRRVGVMLAGPNEYAAQHHNPLFVNRGGDPVHGRKISQRQDFLSESQILCRGHTLKHTLASR